MIALYQWGGGAQGLYYAPGVTEVTEIHVRTLFYHFKVVTIAIASAVRIGRIWIFCKVSAWDLWRTQRQSTSVNLPFWIHL